ncbi:MAG: hypothetical protein K2L46_03180 [Paramuribaculum sp.]|nr:hypothetical protein [Paramuribaculum sp.]
MKRHFTLALSLAIASLIAAPIAEAQSRRPENRSQSSIRHSGQENRHKRPDQARPATSGSTSRPGRPSSGNTGSSHRPGTGNIRPGASTKPSAPPSGSNHNRPGNGNHNGFKPSKPDNNHNRPGNGNHNRPGHSHRPVAGPAFRPGSHRPPTMHPPVRPGRPVIRPWARPVPPPRWRPTYRGSLIGNILGLTYGIALNSALDNLYYNGYAIDGYMTNEVYLTGVNQFNLYWPDATLFFGANGLVRSQFFDPTVSYDVTRYYDTYAYLTRIYGQPAIMDSAGTSLTATWFGAGGDYITLSYAPMTSGPYRYFTTLTIGR